MFSFFKWTVLVLLAGLTWLVALITAEYFRPYQKVRIHLK
jgi:hypothetical protein